ncbi:2785_t:CDS:2 [Entrophospora sp. SA101]|nr:2785_t:CDS:2 [Entrophospora sp. SA101]
MLIKEIQTLENNQKSKEKSEELEEILLDLIRKNYNYTKAEYTNMTTFNRLKWLY